MELTRFDLQNQSIQRRIAAALERLADLLEKNLPGTSTEELRRPRMAIAMREARDITEAYTHGFNTARGIEGDADAREIKKTFDRELNKLLKRGAKE